MVIEDHEIARNPVCTHVRTFVGLCWIRTTGDHPALTKNRVTVIFMSQISAMESVFSGDSKKRLIIRGWSRWSRSRRVRDRLRRGWPRWTSLATSTCRCTGPALKRSPRPAPIISVGHSGPQTTTQGGLLGTSSKSPRATLSLSRIFNDSAFIIGHGALCGDGPLR